MTGGQWEMWRHLLRSSARWGDLVCAGHPAPSLPHKVTVIITLFYDVVSPQQAVKIRTRKCQIGNRGVTPANSVAIRHVACYVTTKDCTCLDQILSQ